MAIDFATSVLPLYTSKVITDAEYLAVVAANRNQGSEQNILTMIEVVRAAMADLRSDQEARLFHNTMSRMLAGVAYNTPYNDVTVKVEGNDPGVVITVADDDTVSITTASGTDAVVLASEGSYTTVADIVAEITTQWSNVDEVEAYATIDGRLGFRNTSGNIGTSFTLAHGAGPSLLNKAGIAAGEYVNPVEVIADAARDDAISHFERGGRPAAANL